MSGFNLSAIAVRERALTLFLMLALAAAGLFAFLNLGRAEDPRFTVKAMLVTVAWPGATAEQMQSQVADKLEKRLQELRYYDRVETQSQPGLAVMEVQLSDTMPPGEVQAEWYQVRKRLSDEARNLPRGVVGPFFNDEFSDIYFGLYALQARGLPHRALVAQAEAVRARLLRVPGVREVDILGEQAGRIHVEVSQQRLATLGVPLDALLAALRERNAVTPAGSIDTGGPRVFMRVDGGFDSIAAIRATPVVAGGRVLRVGDIAAVTRGYEDPPTYRIRHDGEPALMLGVVMRERWNGLDLGRALKAEVSAIGGGLPLGLALTPVLDQSENIDFAYSEFMIKFAVALAVVLVVSLLALGWRVGLVVAASVPLTLAAVFVIMLATGREFDRITLGALILSLGLLVDDAIIAIEMMVVKMEEGLDRVAAATFAWGATAAPMLSGTLVTIIGFLPVGFAASSAGEYAGNIFWIVAFALLVSWFVAVFFTPYLGVRLLPAIEPVAGGHAAIYATPRYERLRGWVAWCVAHNRRVVALTVGALLLSVGGMALVEQQFFPSSDRPELLVEVNLPKGSSIAVTEASVARMERWLLAQPEALVVDSYVGAGAPRFFLSLNPEAPDPAFAKIVIRTDDARARERLDGRLRAHLAGGAHPEARVRVTRLLFGPPVPFPVEFRVHGDDPAVLKLWAERVRRAMQTNADVRDAHLEWGQRAPATRLVLDQDRLRLIGLTPEATARQLGTLLSGVTATQLREGIRTVDVVVRAPGGERRALGELGDVVLTTADGRSVPLAQVARLETRMEEPVLFRRDREAFISVRADIAEGLQPPDVTAALMPAIDALRAELPAGVTIETGGAVEESAKANAALAAVFPVMILGMLVVIMIQVRSFALMAMTFLTAPLGLIGAVLAMLVFQQPFGFNAILGLIGLAGVIMRNTLILVEQIKAEQAAGLAPREAVIEATVRRARPVVLTALAAVLAFVPLTLSSFWGPLAYVLIGGLIVGTVLTLLFLPALYALWFRLGGSGSSGSAFIDVDHQRMAAA